MPDSPPFALPPRAADAHKGTFGRVMIVGGRRGMAGSVALSAIAALHTGSGLVTAAVPDVILETVAAFHPSVMTLGLPQLGGQLDGSAWSFLMPRIGDADALAVGPGIGTDGGARKIVRGLIDANMPLVIDADSLNIVARQDWLGGDDWPTQRTGPIVLTPHPGELQRLTGVAADQQERQLNEAVKLAQKCGVTIVVKGGPTRIVEAVTGEVVENNTGNPAMATAGAGDVLTGIIASLLGQGLSGFDAARLAVWIHGVAGNAAATETSVAGMTSWHLVQTLARVADRMVATQR